MKDKAAACYIAKKVHELGGKTYYVGGCVRDELLDIQNKDIDIEVYGIKPYELKNICSELGEVDEIGMSFGILKIHGYGIDISMPRKERKVGLKHTDFEVNVDPFMNEKEAAKRRDFTINSIMKNIMERKLIDPYNGIYDLRNKIIKHIDDITFVEDPLRVFRAAQFSARFDFTIDQDTFHLCKTIDVSNISRERIFEETNKALLKSNTPSIYFNQLRKMNHLKEFFPELEKLVGVKQNPKYHPEGDVWNHTMMVLDKAAKVKSKSSNPLYFMYAALFHDIGKQVSTTEKDGIIKSIGHEKDGIPLAKNGLNHITNESNLIKYVLNMIENHMTPHLITEKSSFKTTNRFFDKCINPYDQLLLSFCDTPNERETEIKMYQSGWWKGRLNKYEEIMMEPEVTGNDLINLGYTPSPMFSLILKKCHLIHLAGIKKEDIIKQLPSIIKGINKKA